MQKQEEGEESSSQVRQAEAEYLHSGSMHPYPLLRCRSSKQPFLQPVPVRQGRHRLVTM